MRRRAFVVMPFGKKESSRPPIAIDFDRVYHELLRRALDQAGYEVARADSGTSAGDIRTDMFFELVTADLVIADVSIVNGNVFYELGVRHGVCPHGVIVIGNDSMAKPEFDIAPDRIFKYDAAAFESPAPETIPSETLGARITASLETLTRVFSDVSAADRQAVASPVYSHLPGLKPVDWEDIGTSKAKYFTALGADWVDRVRNAQALGRPGDIITLAMNAPTRMHESRILFEAAKALVDMSRFTAAARVLRDVIRLDPDHAEAQIQLAMVLTKLDEIPTAEHELRRLSLEYKDKPRAANILGQVFRHLWHLSWQKEDDSPEPSPRRAKARDASGLAVSAVHSFLRAHRADPRVYFAGYNALMLLHLLKVIEADTGHLSVDVDELTATTRFVARHERTKAIEDGDYEQQFWTTTTLAGLLFIEGKCPDALIEIRSACAIPTATSFQLQNFRDRLELAVELNIEPDFVNQALVIVDAAMAKTGGHCPCERVFLWGGYPVDEDGRTPPRFPASRVEDVTRAIREVFSTKWSLTDRDLAICGGTTESDIIFAEVCLELGARVRIMMRDPIDPELREALWPFKSKEWNERFHNLVPPRPTTPTDRREVWFDSEHLGKPVEGSVSEPTAQFVRHRHTHWLINTAEVEGEPLTSLNDEDRHEEPKTRPGRLYGVFLWDGQGPAGDIEQVSFLIRRVNEFNGYQGHVHIIDPTQG